MTHCLGSVQLASCGPWNVNASQLVGDELELSRRAGRWRRDLVIAVVKGGLIVCNNLPALEDETEETQKDDKENSGRLI